MKDFLRKALGAAAAPGQRYRDKVAVVTGASAGIGRAAAVAFAREGATVALIARRESEGRAVLAEALKAGGEGAHGIFIPADVANTQQVQAAFAKIRDEFGRVDAAFNNAGVMHPSGPIGTIAESEFDRIMSVNVKGVWLCMREELALMEKRGGAIVNMSSMSGLAAFPNIGLYVTSKHAVVGMSRAGALDYAGKGIRVNAICPGYVETDMTQNVSEERVKMRCPTGRMADVDEIAEAVLYLCSDVAGYVNGHAFLIDGGTLTR